jgi:hypothetical protein
LQDWSVNDIPLKSLSAKSSKTPTFRLPYSRLNLTSRVLETNCFWYILWIKSSIARCYELDSELEIKMRHNKQHRLCLICSAQLNPWCCRTRDTSFSQTDLQFFVKRQGHGACVVVESSVSLVFSLLPGDANVGGFGVILSFHCFPRLRGV